MAHEDASSHDNVYSDFAAVRFAVLALLAAFAVQLIIGIYLIGRGLPGIEPRTATRVGLFSLVEAAFLLGLAWGAYKMRSEAVLGGMVLTCFGVVTSLITMQPVIIVINLLLVLAIFKGHRALVKMNQRIESETQTNPMTRYYHRMIPILVRVMGADGHVDRRERNKISQLCNNMNISTYERNYLIKRASRTARQASPASLKLLIEQFLAAGEALDHVIPDLECMYAALAVIESDGVVLPEEVDILQDIGSYLGWDLEEMKQFVLQNRTDLKELDLDKAYEILGLSESATMQQIERAHQDFIAEMNAEQFKHIGTPLGDNVEKRRQILDRAYQVLKDARS